MFNFTSKRLRAPVGKRLIVVKWISRVYCFDFLSLSPSLSRNTIPDNSSSLLLLSARKTGECLRSISFAGADVVLNRSSDLNLFHVNFAARVNCFAFTEWISKMRWIIYIPKTRNTRAALYYWCKLFLTLPLSRATRMTRYASCKGCHAYAQRVNV